MGTYLSKRKVHKNSEKIYLYAVNNIWDSKDKKIKKEQIYLGYFEKGKLSLLKDRIETAEPLLNEGGYKEQFLQWKREQLLQEQRDIETQEDIEISILNAGFNLILGKIAEDLGLTQLLHSVFEENIANDILSLAYFCVAEGRKPLYRAADWSVVELTPTGKPLSVGHIARCLETITASDIHSFQSKWMKKYGKGETFSLDIASIPSYEKNNSDAILGYNRNQETWSQTNLLMGVSKEHRIPLWFEELPDAISDEATTKDSTDILSKIREASRKFVFNESYASEQNIQKLFDAGFKFTIGLPLHRLEGIREKIVQHRQAYHFCDPQNSLALFEEEGVQFTQAVTEVCTVNHHRAYLHMYYIDWYKVVDNAALMSDLVFVQEKLKKGLPLGLEYEKHLATECFEVKTTPVRGIKVTPRLEQIAAMKDNLAGFFAIYSNQFKNPEDALTAYNLRREIEKRFVDLKNEEDARRLRVHSLHNLQSRLFIQFISEILRCHILKRLQDEPNVFGEKITVSDILWTIRNIHLIQIGNHRAFYQRPNEKQKAILDFFGISTCNSMWQNF